ncbi:OmpA family protein [Pontivivens insulae]|uniref:Putative lipoprotein YiaD n=1 Tax=Pontivivens insulae TaxID=1639689 RepID=A0A2R8ABI7_9RHOB|nr:OmpA family protein [Pontivivens insulae]RED11382.1 outer membrane protein OmpA-like peptidoglycan-associated protein [Pontivivens insulae]SPF29445.1 putative lipoprotein YiaD [Pontivivens insulae]
MRGLTIMMLGAGAMTLAACNQGDFSSAASRTEGETFVVVRSATWIDPDGCEHWIFDTGAEGYVTPKLRPDGRPICDPSRAENNTRARLPGFGLVTAADDLNFSVAADATFPVGSAVVQPEARADLTRFFEFLRNQGRSRVLITGHTDNTGGAQANQNLSLARAAAVAEIAGGFGLTAETRGLGASQPVSTNATVAGRASNRRVEIQVVN